MPGAALSRSLRSPRLVPRPENGKPAAPFPGGPGQGQPARRTSSPGHHRRCHRSTRPQTAQSGIPHAAYEAASTGHFVATAAGLALQEVTGKSGSRRFPVTVTHLPVTRCQICHHTVAYRPGKASDALTGHYRQAHPKHPASPPPGSQPHTDRLPTANTAARHGPAGPAGPPHRLQRSPAAANPRGGHARYPPRRGEAPYCGDQLGCAHQADLVHQIASGPCRETSGSA